MGRVRFQAGVVQRVASNGRRAIRSLTDTPRRTASSIRLGWNISKVRSSEWANGEQFRVAYAHRGWPKPPPGPSEFVHGGAVKYGYLHRRIPHSGLRFSILYVVSSGHFADISRLIRVATSRGARVVWNQNGVYHPQSYRDANRLNARMGELYKQADYVLHQSQFCRDSAKTFLGERVGPSEVLYNAIDTDFFVPTKVPRHRGDELQLLIAGTHYSDYRLLTAVHTLAAVRRTRPARLLIAGGVVRNLERDARRLIADLKLEPFVSFLGRYRQSEAPDILRKGQVYLHTKYIDPCPSAVIEAMACGLPIVYSKTGGTAELVGEEAGLGVPAKLSWERDIPPDAERMAECVLRVADNLEGFSKAARERAVSRFDLGPWLSRHAEVFQKVMEA